MNPSAIVGGILLAVGLVANVICVLRYSSFMDRLTLIDPGLANSLLIDGGEGGERNTLITQYFWQGKYMDLSDTSLQKLGVKVRNAGFAGAIFVLLGICLLALQPK